MFDEELCSHLLTSLVHFEFAREMLLRIGNTRAFERYGWSSGEETYTGLPETQVVEDQIGTVLKMTEPRLAADVYFIHYLDESRDDWWRGVRHADGTWVHSPEELPLEDLDFGHALVISSSDAALVERYRRGMARQNPALAFFVYDPEPPGRSAIRLARRYSRPPEPPRPNFLLFVDGWDASPLDTLYGLLRNLVGVWELEKARAAEQGAASRRAEQTFNSRTAFGRSPNPGRRN